MLTKRYTLSLIVAGWFVSMVVLAVWGTPVQGQAAPQKYLPLALNHIPLVSEPPLHNYRGLFTIGNGDARDIFTGRADGSELRPLTQDEFRNDTPQWSADGQLIAYFHATESNTSPNSGQVRPWVMNSDGSNPHDIAPNLPGTVYHMAWSPTRSEILLQLGPTPKPNETYLAWVSVDTGATQILTEHTYSDSDNTGGWSPDGNAFYFYHVTTVQSELWLKPRTRDAVRISTSAYVRVWHPTNGQLLVTEFDREGNLSAFLWSPAGDQRTPLFADPYRFTGWAAHGNLLLLTHKDTGDLYARALYGDTPTLLLENQGGKHSVWVDPRGDRFLYYNAGSDTSPSEEALLLYDLTTHTSRRISAGACDTTPQLPEPVGAVTWARDATSLLFSTGDPYTPTPVYRTCWVDVTVPTPEAQPVSIWPDVAYLPYSSRWAIAQPYKSAYPPPETATVTRIDTASLSATVLFPEQAVTAYEWRYLP